MKKIITIFAFFLLYNCGFEPIYSKKNIDNNYNFSINSIGFSGENKINQTIKNKLLNYLDKKEKIVQLDLAINSTIQKNVTSKSKKGNPETFSMEVLVNLQVFKDNNLISKKTFKENFEYKNKSSKFELNKYEKNIQKNLTNKLSNDLIEYLYYVK